jgi:hypothetical protein
MIAGSMPAMCCGTGSRWWREGRKLKGILEKN